MSNMKSGLTGTRSQLLAGVIVIVIGLLGGISITRITLSRTFASPSMSHISTSPNAVTPTPTPPSGNSVGLSASSGSPGTHIFMAASGYKPGEYVYAYWNYTGPGTGVVEKSYYYFNPTRAADANGNVQESLFVPTAVAGNYTIALIGAQSGVVKTAQFQLVPGLDTGIYIGPAGTVLRIIGWGFAKSENVTLYWNWTQNNNGQPIGTGITNKQGSLGQINFTIPAGTPNGVYTVAGVGSLSGILTQVQFTVGTSIAGGQPGPSDWANYGFDLQNTRVNPTENIIGPSNVSTLALKWKSSAPVPYKTVGEPTIANGIVYVGDVLGILTARSITTGDVLWTFYAKAPIYGSPTIQNGIAYFGSVSYPFGGVVGNYVYALNATDGSLIWENYLPNGAEWATPLAANGTVFVPTALKEGVSGGLSAFDANTGATLWSVSTHYGIWSADSLDPTGTNLYVGTANPCLDGSDPGHCAGYLEDLNPATGTTVWQIQFQDISGDDDVPTAPLYYNGNIYLGAKNGIFYCVNASNGNILWQYSTGYDGDYGIFSSATIYNNMVFFGSDGDHSVHALNASNGSPVWAFKTGSAFLSSPSIANGVLYVGGINKYIYALNPTTGAKLWSYATLASIWSSPTISNGVLYVSGGDGYTYAFSPGGK